MNPRWDESEFVFCDLQTAARYIRRDNPQAAAAFWKRPTTRLISLPATLALAVGAVTWAILKFAAGESLAFGGI